MYPRLSRIRSMPSCARRRPIRSCAVGAWRPSSPSTRTTRRSRFGFERPLSSTCPASTSWRIWLISVNRCACGRTYVLRNVHRGCHVLPRLLAVGRLVRMLHRSLLSGLQVVLEVAPGMALERHFLSPRDLAAHLPQPLAYR